MTNAIHPKLNLGVRSLESSTASFVSVDTQWLELFCRAFFFETQICDARNSWTRKIYCKVKFEATVVPRLVHDWNTYKPAEMACAPTESACGSENSNSKNRSPSECSTGRLTNLDRSYSIHSHNLFDRLSQSIKSDILHD